VKATFTEGRTNLRSRAEFDVISEELIEKIKSLPPERVAEVEDFVDFIAQRDERRLVQAASRLSEESFRQVWDNEEDSAYDQL
jgi:hypothetical protein